MTVTQTPFMLPWQVDQLSVNSFEIRDAGGHLIARLHTHATVVETPKLAQLMAAAGEMRDLLDKLQHAMASIGGALDADGVLDLEPAIRALLARIDNDTRIDDDDNQPPKFIDADDDMTSDMNHHTPANQATYRGWRYGWRSPNRGIPGGWVRIDRIGSVK